MRNSNPRRRGIRYRAATSVSAGVLTALLAAWYGAKHGHTDTAPHMAVVRGDVTLAVVVAVFMFGVWSAIALYRRTARRAAERERAATAAERERQARGGRRGGRRYAGSPR